MSRYFQREQLRGATLHDAVRVVAVLTNAAKKGNGIYAPRLPGLQPRRAIVMQRLREMGVPVYARKAGRSSYWFIISMFPPDTQKKLAKEWRERVLQHQYAETVRGYLALSSHTYAKAEADLFKQHAVDIGLRLGLDLAEMTADMTRTQMGPLTKAAFGHLVNNNQQNP